MIQSTSERLEKNGDEVEAMRVTEILILIGRTPTTNMTEIQSLRGLIPMMKRNTKIRGIRLKMGRCWPQLVSQYHSKSELCA